HQLPGSANWSALVHLRAHDAAGSRADHVEVLLGAADLHGEAENDHRFGLADAGKALDRRESIRRKQARRRKRSRRPARDKPLVDAYRIDRAADFVVEAAAHS